MIDFALQYEYINDADMARAQKSEAWRIQEYARRQERSLRRRVKKLLVIIAPRRLRVWL